MIITILGSGTSIPQKDRSAPSYLVRSEEGAIMVDLGPGAVWNLVRNSTIGIADVGIVLITHLHLDHVADLAPFLFAMKAEEIGRSSPLTVIGPEGFSDYYASLRKLYGRWVEGAGYELEIKEWSGEFIEWGEFRIGAGRSMHSLPNLAYLLQESGPGVMFTGDGEPTPEMLQLGKGATDILISECSLPPGITEEGHMNPEHAGRLAEQIQTVTLVLSHLNPGCKAEEILKEAMAYFGGEIQVAEDGMVLTI